MAFCRRQFDVKMSQGQKILETAGLTESTIDKQKQRQKNKEFRLTVRPAVPYALFLSITDTVVSKSDRIFHVQIGTKVN